MLITFCLSISARTTLNKLRELWPEGFSRRLFSGTNHRLAAKLFGYMNSVPMSQWNPLLCLTDFSAHHIEMKSKEENPMFCGFSKMGRSLSKGKWKQDFSLSPRLVVRWFVLPEIMRRKHFIFNPKTISDEKSTLGCVGGFCFRISFNERQFRRIETDCGRDFRSRPSLHLRGEKFGSHTMMMMCVHVNKWIYFLDWLITVELDTHIWLPIRSCFCLLKWFIRLAFIGDESDGWEWENDRVIEWEATSIRSSPMAWRNLHANRAD